MKFGSHKNTKTSKMGTDLISRLHEIESREKSHLMVAIPADVADQTAIFLKEKGFQRKQGIALLIEYGLSSETEEELESLRIERESNISWLSQKYATMRFRTYQFSEENCTLTMSLRSMINENQALKQVFKKQGLDNCFSKDELGEWDEATVASFYQKYVFKKGTMSKEGTRCQK